MFPRLCVCAVLCALWPAATVHCDLVYLKSGGWVEGIVVEQTQEKVTVDLGFGTTELDMSEVERIERSDDAQATSLRQQWGEDFFDHGRFVPERLKSVSDSLSAVRQARSRALRWQEHTRSLEAGDTRLNRELDSLKACYLDANRRLKTASPHGNVRAYNNLVAEVYSLHADIDIKAHELLVVEKVLDGGNPAVSEYSRRLSFFEHYLEKTKKSLGATDAEEKEFLARIRDMLAEFSKDFSVTTIEKPTRLGKHIVVNARINKTVMGKFILDTGASVVSFSKAFADRLGVDLSQVEPIEVTMANGSTVPAKPLTLRSVALADANVENVRAVVLDEPPSAGVDGLLGMSFLGKFYINIDTHANTLELKRFSVR